MEKIDLKYSGDIYKTKDGKKLEDDEYIVFRTQDRALLSVLISYQKKCVELGCSLKHTNGVVSLISRVANWQAENLDKVKIPD